MATGGVEFVGVVVMWGLLRARWMVDGGRRWVLGSFGVLV